MIRIKVWRISFVLLVTAILYLALAAIETAPPVPTWDKTNHVLAFATLAMVGAQAFGKWPICLHVGLLGFGAAIEAMQSLTPHRRAEWADLLADAIGLIVGALLAQIAKPRNTSGRS